MRLNDVNNYVCLSVTDILAVILFNFKCVKYSVNPVRFALVAVLLKKTNMYRADISFRPVFFLTLTGLMDFPFLIKYLL